MEQAAEHQAHPRQSAQAAAHSAQAADCRLLQRAFLNETSRQRASLGRTFLKGASLQRGCLPQRTLLIFKNFSSNGTSSRTSCRAKAPCLRAVLFCAAEKHRAQSFRRFLLLLPAAWGNYMYLYRLLQLRVFKPASSFSLLELTNTYKYLQVRSG